MKRNVFHIVLSLFLTLAINDYVWVHLLSDDQTVAFEIEKEEKEESREELRESKSEEVKHDFLGGGWLSATYSYSFQCIASGVVAHGNSFNPLIPSKHPRLFILFCQLRLDC